VTELLSVESSTAAPATQRRSRFRSATSAEPSSETNFEGFSWLYASGPALGQDASMKEGIARPIGEFDKAKSLVQAELVGSSRDRRAGRCLETVSLNRGLVPNALGRAEYVSTSKVATPPLTKISMSQFQFPERRPVDALCGLRCDKICQVAVLMSPETNRERCDANPRFR
jgi:hypothetical protein